VGHGSEEVSRLIPLLSAPITMSHGGAKQIFELATDELHLRLPNGSQSVVSIPKASTPEDFAAAIEKARAEHGAEPELVLYIAGAPRNKFSRRIVTRDVVISADSRAEADALAREGGLVFQKKLDFAPDTFVYKASTSLQGLSFQIDSEAINLAGISTQLAKQAATMSMPNDPYIQLQWHLKNTGQKLRLSGGGNYTAFQGIDINVESLWNYPSTKPFAFTSTNNAGSYIRGNGIVIGIVDDSLQWKHPDLAVNVIDNLQWDWNQKDSDPSPYNDDDAHGTACAGVAAARGNNRLGVSGVAPEASLVGMRLISGPSTDLDEAEAMVWKYDEIDIKSNSWGYPSVSKYGYYSLYKNGDLANAAIKHAITHGRDGKGTIFTFAAGNSFEYTTIDETDPDNPIIQKIPSGARVEFSDYQGSMYTIAVGAIDSSGKKSYYSQIGSSLLVSAPSDGEIGIMTADRTGFYGYNDVVSGSGGSDIRGSGDYSKTFGGTSSACPTVSGVIALMLQKNPDLGWRDVQEILIRSSNNTFDADGWETNGAGIKFNYNYGAGLVDAEAAVNMADGWDNLGSQKSQTIATNAPETIAAGATLNRTFTVNGTNLRVEHVTLQLTFEDIKKGNLTITLISQNGTESIFCEPHDDDQNSLENWKFMTVRNWGEMSNGNWTISITNGGATSGNLTDAELVVYGTEMGAATNPAPVVTLAASRTQVFVGSNLTLNATAIDQNADATTGTVEALEAFANGTSLGLSENGRWTVQANEAGTFSFMVNATDSEGETSTSQSVVVEVLEAPIAAWDFDTTSQSPTPLATVVQSIRKYAANFGSGNLTFDGSFDGGVANSNKWEYGQGQIFMADGTAANAVADMQSGTSNKALLLRAGKNIGAEGKSIVFEFSMAGKESLSFSYAADVLTDGFTTHTWSYSSNGTVWTDLETVNPAPGFSTLTLNQTAVLDNSTTAYLRLRVSGSGAASGQNLIDNIILSATPIAGALGGGSGGGVPASARTGLSSESAYPDPTPGQTASSSPGAQPSQTASCGPSDLLDWTPRVAVPILPHQMLVHAEVVDGARFVNAPGSVLSATKDGQIWALADPTPQSTRYDLLILASEPDPALLRLKIYDSESKGILVLEEKVPFTPDATIGSSATPKRYQVAYQETEQVVQISPGWNTFTTAVDPDPATLEGALIDYDATEGDRLVGASAEASVVQGKWNPPGLELKPQATYTLLRQAPNASQIVLKGKALPQQTPKPPHDRYGIWMDLPDGSIVTADWCDADGDQIDDRFQPGPGMPMQRRAPMPLAPVSAAQPAAQPAAPQQSSQPTAAPREKNPSKKSGLSKKSSKKSSKKQKATRKS